MLREDAVKTVAHYNFIACAVHLYSFRPNMQEFLHIPLVSFKLCALYCTVQYVNQEVLLDAACCT